MPKRPIDVLNEPEPIADSDQTSPLPHEKDESPEAMASRPRQVIKNAANDIKRGVVDTDRGPEMAKAYRKQK